LIFFFIQKLIKDTNASLIIKGDDHQFSILKYNLLNHRLKIISNRDDDEQQRGEFSLDLNLSGEVIEISIPTCSYRMGFKQMGFGLLKINVNSNTNKAFLSIIWLPSRYSQLYNYLYFTFFVIIFLIFGKWTQRLFLFFYTICFNYYHFYKMKRHQKESKFLY
jgi:hypothetical protein